MWAINLWNRICPVKRIRWKPCAFFFTLRPICVSVQAAEKEALLVQHGDDRAEQRRKAKAEKKAQKKSQKTNRTGDKRKADDVGEDEWGEETGKDGYEECSLE